MERSQGAQSVPVWFDRGTLCAPLHLPRNLQTAAYWTDDPRNGCLRCSAIHYRELFERIQGLNDEVAAWMPVTIANARIKQLRDYQIQARDVWLAQKRGILVMPTGSGKTEVAMSIIEQLQCSTLVVCPLRALMYQWKERLEKSLQCKIGIIGDTHKHIRPITVTTYQSAWIHMGELGNQFKCLVFDECHHLPGPSRSEAARLSAAPYRLGLTATPPKDARWSEIQSLIGALACEIGAEQIPKEFLAEHTIRKIEVELTSEERDEYLRLGKVIQSYVMDMKQTDPDFVWNDAQTKDSASLRARQALRAHRRRIAIEERAEEKMDVLEYILCEHPEAQAIIFTGSNQMGYELSQRFLIPCLLEHCDSKERKVILDGFREQRYRAIISNQVLDEGVDLVSAKIAIILGGKSTTQQAEQRLGRIKRKCGDQFAYLYEVICKETKEVNRSRQRRKSDAYQGTSTFRF